MRHLKKGRKFGRERNQRHALLKSLATALFLKGAIVTTEAKAKSLRPFAERSITRGRVGTLQARRILLRMFSPAVTRRIMERGKTFEARAGGYTRIIRMGPRASDHARMARIEFVGSK